MHSSGLDLRTMGSASSIVCLGAMMFSTPGSPASIEWGAGGLLAFGLSRLVPRRRPPPVRRAPEPEPIQPPEPSPAQPFLVRLPSGAHLEIDPSFASTHPALRAAFRTSVDTMGSQGS